MHWLQDLFPSMFHRRLLLLAGIGLLLITALGAQLARLAVLEHDRRLDDAEAALSTSRLLPTVRGSIFDAKGRILAQDVPSEDIAVDYDVISGEWAYQQARQDAYRQYADSWAAMSFDQREELIHAMQSPYDEQEEQLWSLLCEVGRISREELEQRKAVVVRRVQMIRADVWDRQARLRDAERSEPVELADVAIRVAEQNQPHTLLPAVGEETALRVRKLEGTLPGVHVIASKRRAYPLTEAVVRVSFESFPSALRRDESRDVRVPGFLDHLVGEMRDVWAEDVASDDPVGPYRRPDGSINLAGYLPGDRTGKSGTELSEESRLRGTRGIQIDNIETHSLEVREPAPGKDVQLTIDTHLQARIQALLDPSLGLMRVQEWHGDSDTPVGTPLEGAVIVLEVDSGNVLAAVSTSSEKGQGTGDRGQEGLMTWAFSGNRVFSAVYPPGSTLKPIVYALAASRRAVEWDQVIDCHGHYLDDRTDILRCWIYRERFGFHTHGPLGPVEAIARSCNIYFYTCGERLGAVRLIQGLHEFGFGRSPGTGLGGELPGLMPSLEGPNPPGRELSRDNAIQMGIGQGPIAATPMQVAAAHAALARGGYYASPVLIMHRRPQQESRDLNIPDRVIDNVLRGLYDSANADFGTGEHLAGGEPILTLEGVRVRSKTGTAQAPTQFDDANDNGRLDAGERLLRSGEHSWYVCHVQRPGQDRAAYIIVTLVEYGGSGARVSGPITNQVLYALRAEGYL